MVWLFTYLSQFSLIFLLSSTAVAAEGPKVEFRKEMISVGGKNIEVELAENDEQRAHGLMYRNHLAPNSGMLFIFPNEQPLSFWMKNTFIDLSIGFFNKDRTLVDIQEMKKTKSVMDQDLPSYSSAKDAMYALEMNKGWFKKNKIKLGSRFEFLEQPKSRSKSH